MSFSQVVSAFLFIVHIALSISAISLVSVVDILCIVGPSDSDISIVSPLLFSVTP